MESIMMKKKDIYYKNALMQITYLCPNCHSMFIYNGTNELEKIPCPICIKGQEGKTQYVPKYKSVADIMKEWAEY